MRLSLKKLFFPAVFGLICINAYSQEPNIDTNQISIEQRYSDENDSEEYEPMHLRWYGFIRNRYYRQKTSEEEENIYSNYSYQRVLTGFKNEKLKLESGAVVLRRTNEPPYSFDNFDRYLLKKYYIMLNDPLRSGMFIAGNYSLSFGEGLVFYNNLSEFMHPVKFSDNKCSPDTGTSSQNYLFGIVWNKEFGDTGVFLFSSKKELNGEITNGSANVDIYSLRDDDGLIETETDLKRFHTFEENLGGARVYSKLSNLTLGLSAIHSQFSLPLNPEKQSGYYEHVFRGDRITVLGSDIDYRLNNLQFRAEMSGSKTSGWDLPDMRGNAWSVTPMYSLKPYRFFFNAYSYDPYYFNRHAQGPSFDGGVPNHEKGFLAGFERKTVSNESLVYYRNSSTKKSNWKLSSASTSPNQPSANHAVCAEHTYKPLKNIEIFARGWFIDEEKYIDTDSSDLYMYEQLRQKKLKSRFQLSWKNKNINYKIRYDRIDSKTEKTGIKESGSIFWNEVSFSAYEFLDIAFKTAFFDSQGATLSEYEPAWAGIYQSNTLGSSSGVRYYLTLKSKISNNLIIWLKSAQTDYESEQKLTTDYRIQIDYIF